MSYNLNSKWLEEIYKKQDLLGYDVIDISDSEIVVKCRKCDALVTNKIDSFISNRVVKNSILHGDSCSKYYNNIIRSKYQEKVVSKFKAYYRYAHERCCNPNNKDYHRYNGKWKFDDYVDYYKGCFVEFEKSIKKYGLDSGLSIDRIDGTKGYEIGNVRFVPMYINSQNKDIVIPCMAVNIETQEIIKAESINELAIKYFGKNNVSAINGSIKNNGIYLNKWKIFHTIKTRG